MPDEDRLGRVLADVRGFDVVDASVSRVRPLGALVATVLAGTLAVVAVSLLAVAPVPPPQQLLALVLLLVLYVLAFRVEFESAAGGAVPTQPVLVALVFLGPVHLVPAVVLAGVLIGGFDRGETGSAWHDRCVAALSAWHCLGPVAVLLVAGATTPTGRDWPLLVVALVLQFVLDAAVATVRMASIGVSPAELVSPLRWTFGFDALMAVIGASLVLCSRQAPLVVQVGLVAVPVALIAMLARDRNRHLDGARVLREAFDDARSDAATDPMTGLGNRRLWEEAVGRAQEARDRDPGCAVLAVALDLDGLKYANDTFGHEAGDALIVALARLLADEFPDASALARLGGDEFGVLLVGTRLPTPEEVVDRIRNDLAAHRAVGPVALSASIGAAATPPHPRVLDAAAAADQLAAEDKRRRRVERRTDPPPARP